MTLRKQIRLFTASLLATIALASISLGCALHSQGKHIATVGNVALYESLSAVSQTADTLRQTNVITQEQRQQIAVKLVPAIQTAKQIDQLTLAWPTGKPAPAEIRTLVDQMKGLLDGVLAAWPDSPAKAALVSKLSTVQQAVITLLILLSGA